MINSIMELLEEIDSGKYAVTVVKGDELYPVYGVVSHSSYFNFSLTVKDNEDIKNIPIIKYGELVPGIDIQLVDKETFGIYNFKTSAMNIFNKEKIIKLEDIVGSMLSENYLNDYVKLYRDLKKEYSVPSTPINNYTYKENPETLEFIVVPCLSYEIINKLESTIILSSLRESCTTWEDANIKYRKYNSVLTSTRFHTRSMIYQLENMKNNSLAWSDLKPLPRSKKKSFQEINIPLYDIYRNKEEVFTVRRTLWNEEIKI